MVISMPIFDLFSPLLKKGLKQGSILTERGMGWVDNKTKKVLMLMKKVRIEKDLSYQDIVGLCTENGDHVSLSTVKRVFSQGSEEMGFRYDTTLQPIVKVVLGLNEEDSGVGIDAKEPGTASENDALRSLIDLKNQMVSNLNQAILEKNQQIEHLKESMKEQLADKEKKVAFLKDLVAEQKTAIRWYRVALTISVVFAVLLLLLVVSAMMVDKVNPNIGFFWLE